MRLKVSRKYLLIIIALLVITVMTVVASPFLVINRDSSSISKHKTDHLPDRPINDLPNYQDSLARVATKRTALARQYQQADTPEKKRAIIEQARETITSSIYGDIFPFWYGTAWDFNGTTETPRQGKIACGYFVSTVLRDAGWRVERTRMAQQASENIILSLTTDAYIKRFRQVAISNFISAVKEWGAGLYIVGLDIHVGFIINTGDEIYFIHS
ncbi:MAG: hypothetical protein AB1489_21800, partial [Acidobacteriota bacterium]